MGRMIKEKLPRVIRPVMILSQIRGRILDKERVKEERRSKEGSWAIRVMARLAQSWEKAMRRPARM